MSSKVPYMPFYPSDYLSDRLVRSFTLEQHGAYMLLLMEMWNAGGWLPDDDHLLAKTLGITARKWKTLRATLICEEITEFDGKNIVEHDRQLKPSILKSQPIVRVQDPESTDIFITQKRLLAEYRKTVSLLEKKREGGRKGGSTPKGVLKESLKSPKGVLKESLSTPQGELKDSSSNIRVEVEKRREEKDQNQEQKEGELSRPQADAPSPSGIEDVTIDDPATPGMDLPPEHTSSPTNVTLSDSGLRITGLPPVDVPRAGHVSLTDGLALWNTCAKDAGLPLVKGPTVERRRHWDARAAPDRTADWWSDYFTRITRLAFCRGENPRGWRANFDWAIRSEDVVMRVLEGVYDSAKGGQDHGRSAAGGVDARWLDSVGSLDSLVQD